MSKELQINKEEYGSILKQALEHIQTARIAVAKQLNSATQSVYWNLGKLISEKQLAEGYGSAVVHQLSKDLKKEFPDMGVSPRNLWDMKRFFERYDMADQKLRQVVAVLPWGHNLLLLNKVQSLEAVENIKELDLEITIGRKNKIVCVRIRQRFYIHWQSILLRIQ